MTRGQLALAIVGMIALELAHLKWIWLAHWKCPKCSARNLDCACPSRRLLKYL